MTEVDLAVDVGGTKISVATVGPGFDVEHVRTLPTPAAPTAILDAIEAAARDVRARSEASGRTVHAVGIGTAGVVDADGTVRSATGTIPGWAGTRVGPEIRRRLGLPTVVLNDVHAFALAEAAIGAARDVGVCLAVMVGTGIGGAIVGPHGLWRGATGTAGSLGHVPSVRAGTMPCSCGLTGHVESIASGPGIAALYRARTGVTRTTRDIAALCRAGDPAATEVVADAGAALGEALAAVVDIVDPDVVVLAGGVLEIGGGLADGARASLRAHALPGPASVRVAVSTLGADAVLVGAALHAHATLDGPGAPGPGDGHPNRTLL